MLTWLVTEQIPPVRMAARRGSLFLGGKNRADDFGSAGPLASGQPGFEVAQVVDDDSLSGLRVNWPVAAQTHFAQC